MFLKQLPLTSTQVVFDIVAPTLPYKERYWPRRFTKNLTGSLHALSGIAQKPLSIEIMLFSLSNFRSTSCEIKQETSQKDDNNPVRIHGRIQSNERGFRFVSGCHLSTDFNENFNVIAEVKQRLDKTRKLATKQVFRVDVFRRGSQQTVLRNNSRSDTLS